MSNIKKICLAVLCLFAIQMHSQGLLFNNANGIIDVVMSKNVKGIIPTDNHDGLKLLLKDGSEKIYLQSTIYDMETFKFEEELITLRISDGTATDITAESATIKRISTNFTYNLLSNYNIYVIYGKSSNLSLDYSLNAYATASNGSCDVKLSKLSPETLYYYQTLIKLNGKFYTGKVKSFETKALPVSITVTTKDATNVQEKNATLNGSVSVSNASKDYTVGFFISTSGTPSSSNYTKKVESGSNKTGNYSSSVTGLSANSTYRVRAFALYDGIYYYGETKNFVTSTGTTGTLNGHEWVDLGLPSGTKWAKCNVGSTTPEGYGDYFAWGETVTKTVYNLNTYSLYPVNGYIYIEDIGGTSYDAAHVKWGSLWRIPTGHEQAELLEYCTYTWTTINGVKGGKFTGPNGNSIFMPASGAYYYNDLRDKLIKGYYWSSNIFGSGGLTDMAYGMSFESGRAYLSGFGRVRGQNIRPVFK